MTEAYTACIFCDGTGAQNETECATCNGQGQVTAKFCVECNFMSPCQCDYKELAKRVI